MKEGSARFDPKKPHGTVHGGITPVRFEQGGRMFGANGHELVHEGKKKTTARAAPAPRPKAAKKTETENKETDSRPEDELDGMKMSQLRARHIEVVGHAASRSMNKVQIADRIREAEQSEVDESEDEDEGNTSE